MPLKTVAFDSGRIVVDEQRIAMYPSTQRPIPLMPGVSEVLLFWTELLIWGPRLSGGTSMGY
jgi:hypothetical protein